MVNENNELVNHQLGGFRVMARIAAGGFGTVWKAESPDHKRIVAIKVLNRELRNDKKAIQTFEAEYELSREFDHPGLLKYYDIDYYKTRPAMVMDYFKGQPLKTVISGAGRGMVLAKANNIIINIALAMGHFHSQGIIHKDIKPENILVNENGEIKIIDFSTAEKVAKGITAIFGFRRKTEGTPAYMSPEQIKNKAPHPSFDMYSFGAMLFEIFAGRPVFIGKDQSEVLNMHVNAVPPPLSKFNKDVTDGFDKLVKSMLSKDPAGRPANMQTFLRRFKQAGVFLS